MSAKLQTILIPKTKSLSDVNTFLKKKKYKLSFRGKKPLIEGDYWHCRQSDPKKNVKYFTVDGKGGIKYVYFRILK